jgi:glutaredoxin
MKPIRFYAVLAAMLATAVLTPAHAQYRWTDGSGKVHYGDSPPRDAKDVRPLGLRAAPAAADESAAASLPYEVRRATERAPVVLYTSPDCQPCAAAAALLRERGVPYAERTVRSPDDLQEFRRISGGLRLPYLTVGSQSQSGFDPDGWLALLDAAGYPKGSMLPRSYQWSAAQPLVPPAKPEGKAAEPAAAEPQAAQTPPAKR